MALVKMVRDVPEVKGGNTTAMIPEDAVKEAIDNGWRKADEKKVETPVKSAPVNNKAEEKVDTKPVKEEVKTDTPKAQKKRDE